VIAAGERTAAAERTLALVDELFDGYRPRDFAVRLWDGTERGPDPAEEVRFTLVLNHEGALRAMLRSPAKLQLSLAEAFLHGDVDVDGDLEAVFPLADWLLIEREWGRREQLRLARRALELPANGHERTGRGPARLRGRRDSAERLAQAVHYHYDLDPEFYGLFLDRRLVYTCGYFRSPDDDLDAAQEQKLDYVCRKLRLREGERLLDVGCGWGGLVLHAADRYGVDALGVTLSAPQAALANERIRAAGLAERCRVEVRDFREVSGSFDKVASIGMFEHLTEGALPEYFGHVHRVLKPSGAFLNHGIGEPPTVRARGGGSFTMAYIFPDCELLPISTTLREAERAGFEVRDVESLREHYALTVSAWRSRLEANRERAVEVADEVIYRVWRLGMAGFVYGQRVGRLNLWQALLVKPGPDGSSGLPLTREDWYA
jgi:cyclopropane-fatty-acyl-phospholipid synthase